MKKIVLLSFVLAFVFSSNARTCLGQQTPKENAKDSTKANEKNSPETLKITGEDKFQIVKSILEQTPEIKSRALPEWALDKLVINLSEKNIADISPPKFPKVEFVILTVDDVKNYKGVSLNFREFEYFEPEKYKITVYFSNITVGGGYFPSKYKTTYECRNENEKWICRAVGYAIYN